MMELKTAKKLNDLFGSVNDYDGKSIVEEGKVKLRYICDLTGSSVEFVLPTPSAAISVLERMHEQGNRYGREGVLSQIDGEISPANLSFFLYNPEYYHDDGGYNGDIENSYYLDPIMLSFTHPDSPSKVRISSSKTRDFLIPFPQEVGDGPLIDTFIEHIRGAAKWSDVDFVSMLDPKVLNHSDLDSSADTPRKSLESNSMDP